MDFTSFGGPLQVLSLSQLRVMLGPHGAGCSGWTQGAKSKSGRATSVRSDAISASVDWTDVLLLFDKWTKGLCLYWRKIVEF